MSTLNEQYYQRSVGLSSPMETEKFVYQLVSVFESLRDNNALDSLSKKKGMSTLFEALLYDIDRRTQILSTKYINELNSVEQMKAFVKDIYNKMVNGEEVFGMEYKILTNKDFGYHIAYDMYNPRQGSFEPRKVDYPTDNLPFAHVVQEAAGLILVW